MVQSTHLVPILFCALVSGISTLEIMASKQTRAAAGKSAPNSTSTLPKALACFTTDLYREFTRNIGADKNRVMSPLGLNILLGMVFAGTGGDTTAAMRKSMKLSSMNDSAIFSGYMDMLVSLNSQKSVELMAANKMFVATAYPVKPTFVSRIRDTFRGDIESLDFANLQTSAATINTWVKGKTNGKIKDLVSERSLDSGTKLLLVNAIYFKGKWKKAFLTSRPLELPFYTNPKQGKHIVLPFMESAKSGYERAQIPELNAIAMLMPYEGDRFVMIALLPNEESSLADMEKRIGQGFDLTSLPALIDGAGSIKVFFPKFKMESTISYVGKEKILEKLGLGGIISPNANFSMLSEHKGLKLSYVFQKAVIEITEVGTEAAAATAGGMVAVSMGEPQPPPLHFNRPFMGYILDRQTKTILFMYRKTN